MYSGSKVQDLFNASQVLFGAVTVNWQAVADMKEYEGVHNGYDGVGRQMVTHMTQSNQCTITRAPLGYFYNAPHALGGGLFRAPPPLISETTGPILKIQAAFETPGKTVEGKQIVLTSGSRVTSQVRSKSKCSTFRAW